MGYNTVKAELRGSDSEGDVKEEVTFSLSPQGYMGLHLDKKFIIHLHQEPQRTGVQAPFSAPGRAAAGGKVGTWKEMPLGRRLR